MTAHHLFDVYGIEAEYMIVDSDSLAVRPVADQVLQELSGQPEADFFEDGRVSWSNELCAHLLEIKCSEPEEKLTDLDLVFHSSILKVISKLSQNNLQLLPTAMHPFMNPLKETRLWPYGQKEIYNQFNFIFGCQGHGWSNLQSVHINLPFGSEDEFVRLHSAIRLVLPLIPWLAASSPFVENQLTSYADNRIIFYRDNQKKIPLITGSIVPEAIYSFDDYQSLLQKIYDQLKPHDPKGVLCHPWVNSRGCIPKFDDGALEIRVMDIQESPLADFALVQFIVLIIQKLCDESNTIDVLSALNTQTLADLFIKSAGYEDFILPQEYTSVFLKHQTSYSINDFLKALYERWGLELAKRYAKPIELILDRGNLAKRIQSSGQNLTDVYQKLAQCLKHNQLYED